MTLTLDLTPEEETRLQALAANWGMELTKFARLQLGLTRANGEDIGQTDAERNAPQARTGERIEGLHRGQVWMSDDFDAPMTDEFTEGKL